MKIPGKRISQFLAAVVLILSVGYQGFSVDAPKLLQGHTIRYVIQAGLHDPIQLAQLSHWLTNDGFDVAGINAHKGTVEVITGSEGIQLLTAKGLKGGTFEQFTGHSPTGPDPQYLNPATVEAHLKALNQAYPQLTRLEQLGTSLQGRPIWALLISDTPLANDPAALNKPVILVDGQHHAREVMSSEIVSDMADTLLSQAATDLHTQDIIHNWQIWIVPMINVDGTNIVFSSDNMWRKNAHADQNNVYGVDINRNYNYRWAGCNGSSTDESADDYHGASAGSEPETQVMMNFAAQIHPTASLSYHSYGEFVLYPYGCGGSFTNENVMIQKIAGELSALLPTDDGQGNYAPGTAWQLLYDVDGSSMDYYYADFGALAYTFEVNQDFQPPYTERAPTLVKHRAAWMHFFDRITPNMLTVSVTDRKTGLPGAASVNFDTIPHNQQETSWNTNAAGKYFKVLDPGQYNVTVQLADGRTATAAVTMAGQPVTVVLTL